MKTINVRFDETNGSQKEHLHHDLDELPLDEVIRSMTIGDIRPVEANVQNDERVPDIPMFPYIAQGVRNQIPEENGGQNEADEEVHNNANPEENAHPEGNANAEENVEPHGNEVSHPRVRRRVDGPIFLSVLFFSGFF